MTDRPFDIGLSRSVEAGFRTRGYNDAIAGRDTTAGESIAERAGEKALQAYRTGKRAGERARREERSG